LTMTGDQILQAQLEQAVAVRHHEGLAGEQRLGVLDAAAGVEDRILPRVPDAGAEACAVAEVLLDEMAQVMGGEGDFQDAAGVEEVEDVLEEGAAVHRHERLRHGVRERGEAGPASRRQHHGSADHDVSAASSGTYGTTSCRAGASAGKLAKSRRATP